MKANEIRLGNIIMFDNLLSPKKELIVNAGLFSALAGGRMRSELKPDEELNFYHKPIHLTHEWIIKLGFEDNGENTFRKNQYVILLDNDDALFGLQWESLTISFLATLKYVHELQNLYFALTKEELEIYDQLEKN